MSILRSRWKRTLAPCGPSSRLHSSRWPGRWRPGASSAPALRCPAPRAVIAMAARKVLQYRNIFPCTISFRVWKKAGKRRCGNMPGWSKAETWHQPAPAAGGADRQLSCPEKAGRRRCPRICGCRPRLCESHVKEFAGIPHAAVARRQPVLDAAAANGTARSTLALSGRCSRWRRRWKMSDRRE